jgi:hypothetical protein
MVGSNEVLRLGFGHHEELFGAILRDKREDTEETRIRAWRLELKLPGVPFIKARHRDQEILSIYRADDLQVGSWD